MGKILFYILLLFSLIFFTFFIIFLLFFNLKKKNFKHVSINHTKNTYIKFDTIYQTLLNETINKFNYQLKLLKANIIFQYLIFLVSLVLGIQGLFYYKFSDKIFLAIIIFFSSATLFILYLIFLVKNDKSKKSFSIYYKNNVISNFFELLNSNLTYHKINSYSYNNIEEGLYNAYKYADFDNKSFNNITITDCIDGILNNNTKFKMCDLKAEKIIDRNSFVKFEGLFVCIDTPKNINSYIKIKNNKSNPLKNSNLVQLDNDSFEKYFDVYSDNKILAMRILTLDTIEYLLDFYNSYNLKFEIILKNYAIYIRFFTNSVFELDIFGDSTNKSLLYSYYILFEFINKLSQKITATLQDIDL